MEPILARSPLSWELESELIVRIAEKDEFTKGKQVIDAIQTLDARLPEEENYSRNYHDFLASLEASRQAINQLESTLDKGNDVTKCIESGRYDKQTRQAISDLQTITASMHDHTDQYLKSCDKLVELLQARMQPS